MISFATYLVPIALAGAIGQATVIDGDTIEIQGERIRLHGIDAPESGQWCHNRKGERYRCGQKSSLALADMIGDRVVRCVEVDRDRYGRIVGKCDVDRQDLGEWMVRQGWAVAYIRYSYDYVRAETFAKSARLGVWQGPFVMPWAWRRGVR